MESPPREASSTDPAADAVGGASGETQPDEAGPGESFRAAQATIAQLIDYVRYYVSVRLDAMRASARNVAFYILLGIIGALALASVIVTAAVMICVGLGEAISALLGHHAWLGHLIVGLLLLGGLIGSILYLRRRLDRSFQRAAAKKYAARRAQQRARFGEDIRGSQGEHGN